MKTRSHRAKFIDPLQITISPLAEENGRNEMRERESERRGVVGSLNSLTSMPFINARAQ